MITNPQVGMRVRTVNPDGALWTALINQVGIITSINQHNRTALVHLDFQIWRNSEWSIEFEHLEAYKLLPEEQDLINREKHADQYL